MSIDPERLARAMARLEIQSSHIRGLESTDAAEIAPEYEIDADATVWADLESDEMFNAGMARAREDFEAGRFTPYRHIAPRPDRGRSDV